MAGVLIHDGRRGGQLKWSYEAIQAGVADGVIITPFSTPRVAMPRNPSAKDVTDNIRDIGGEVIFDPMTHAALLPNSDRVDIYDDWHLWANGVPSLDSAKTRISHVERVLNLQDKMGVPLLAPSISLQSPNSPQASQALETAYAARGLDTSTWQSLAGTRSFWASGAPLDAHIGSLAALRAPVWVVTLVNDAVTNNIPDLTDVAAFEGLCRSIHSLSIRSRVIVAHADFAGLPGVAAGADSLGSGWDRGQRTFDPLSFQQSDGGPRRSASYVTQGGLLSVLRRETADDIDKWDRTRATEIRGGPMPPSDQAERIHHFEQLQGLVRSVDAPEPRAARVEALRQHYARASDHYDDLIPYLRPAINTQTKAAWVDAPWKVLESYASSEGL